MNRPLVTLALTLALLLQGLASAWAAAGMAAVPVPSSAMAATTHDASSMPCHAQPAADAAADARSGNTDCCDDAGTCTRCGGVCSASPTPPAAAGALADYLAEHYASVQRTDAVLFANPLDILRPPITLLR